MAILLATSMTRAQIQVIQASDLHSQYNHTLNFIASVAKLQADFKAKYPDGVSILLFNGDVSGPSEWTDIDQGMAFFKMAAHLSNQFDGFAFTLGNHDGWSLGGPSIERGNTIFYRQALAGLKLFRQFSKHSGRYTTANIEVNRGFEYMFQPSIDVDISASRKIRVVGLIGETVLTQSNYDPEVSPNPISKVRSPLEIAKNQIELAASAGVTDLYFMEHEGYEVIEKDLPALMKWKGNHPDSKVRKLNMPVYFSAHTHLRVNKRVAGVDLIESGSRYQFSEVLLDEDGAVQKTQHFDWDAQRELARSVVLEGPAKDAYLAVEPVIREMTAKNSVPLLYLNGIPAIRKDLRAGRHWLGYAMADTFRNAAISYGIANGLKFDDAFALFTSDAYRRDEILPPGMITAGEIKSMHPLPNEVVIGIMSGAQLKELLGFVRSQWKKKGEFSPQTSSNLVEDGDQIMMRKIRQRYMENHLASELADQGQYLVAFDGFNGRKVRNQSLKQPWGAGIDWHIETGLLQTKVIEEYLPKVLMHPDIRHMRPMSCNGAHLQ